MKNIHLFRSKKDLNIKLTDDNIINIIGSKGSGKTTSALKYINVLNYFVVNCDRLYSLPSDEIENNNMKIIKKRLIKKYGSDLNKVDFKELYKDIIEYSRKEKKKLIIEGNQIQELPIEEIKGVLIIKRTALFKCYIRSVKRDYKNKYFMDLEKEKHKHLYKVTRFFKISKRRKKIFKEGKVLDQFINNIEVE